MGFVPIQLRDYARKHVKCNPGSNEREVITRLRDTLGRYKTGARCECGEPIWVIGSAELGDICFTCATLEADPSEDYEIAEACNKMPRILPEPDSSLDASFLDSDQDDLEVPF